MTPPSMDGSDAEENRPSSPPLAQEVPPSAAGVVVPSVTPSAAGGPSALPLATGMDGVVGSPVTPAAVGAAPMRLHQQAGLACCRSASCPPN